MPSAAARAQAAWTSNFFVVGQLLEANSHAERAAILLRVSDAVIAAKAEQLQGACRERGFDLGADYVDIRNAAQARQRDAQGNLPAETATELEYWRRGMVAIAGGPR